MEEPTDTIKEKESVVTPKVPETPAEPDVAAEVKKEKENEPEIAITQVPMDGVCGGY